MECIQAQDRLLDLASPAELRAEPELAEHVQGCAACQGLLADLAQLEQSWRAWPLPAQAGRARAAFLERLPGLVPAAARSGRWAPHWLTAALVFLALGAAAWWLWPAPQAQAAPDLVESLVDWNLDLTSARDLVDRGRIYADRADDLTAALGHAELPADDRELADQLLATGSRLAHHANPVDEADEFNDLADLLIQRLDAATRKSDLKRIDKLARLLGRVADQGIAANLERAPQADLLDRDRQGKWERIQRRNAERAVKLAAILERSPQGSRKAIHQALDKTRKHPGRGKRLEQEPDLTNSRP